MVETIISYVLLGIGVLSTIVSIGVAVAKAKKNGNTKKIVDLVNSIPSLVRQAETMFGVGKGTAKMAWVLQELRLKAMEDNICITTADLEKQVNDNVETLNYEKNETKQKEDTLI